MMPRRPLSTLQARPATPAELNRLGMLWRAMLPGPQILAEFPDRTARDVLLMLFILLGPDRPVFDDEWEGRCLDRALLVLSRRARRWPGQAEAFLLDGRFATLPQVIDAANEFLAALALPLIAYPKSKWRIAA
ncbi:MAG: hypothetical protein WC722_05760 [Rhodospirillales bacterium]|jgi:hypothetical protein